MSRIVTFLDLNNAFIQIKVGRSNIGDVQE